MSQEFASLIIVVRQSPDWGSINREVYREESRHFCRMMGRPDDLMNTFLDLWDDTFRISYFQTRQRMKDLATVNLAQVHNARIADVDNLNLGESSLVCFVDDDDWFHPEIAEHLGSVGVCDGVIWGHAMFGWHDKAVLQVRDALRSDVLCFTNNYAVSANYILNNGVYSVFQHGIANQTFKELTITKLAKVLSMTNKHPTSAVFLEGSLSGEPSSVRLTDAVAAFVKKLSILDEPGDKDFAWAMPLMREVRNHFDEVLRSTKAIPRKIN